jgi:hypothetical protein
MIKNHFIHSDNDTWGGHCNLDLFHKNGVTIEPVGRIKNILGNDIDNQVRNKCEWENNILVLLGWFLFSPCHYRTGLKAFETRPGLFR